MNKYRITVKMENGASIKFETNAVNEVYAKETFLTAFPYIKNRGYEIKIKELKK